MGTLFKLKFPTVDDITDRITQLNGNCLLCKIDLQRAFRHLKLDPRDINKTGLLFEAIIMLKRLSPLATDMDLSACKG